MYRIIPIFFSLASVFASSDDDGSESSSNTGSRIGCKPQQIIFQTDESYSAVVSTDSSSNKGSRIALRLPDSLVTPEDSFATAISADEYVYTVREPESDMENVQIFTDELSENVTFYSRLPSPAKNPRHRSMMLESQQTPKEEFPHGRKLNKSQSLGAIDLSTIKSTRRKQSLGVSEKKKFSPRDLFGSFSPRSLFRSSSASPRDQDQ